MTIPEILKELELYTGKFPMDAMKAAIEQREAITPELLRVIEEVAADPSLFSKRVDYMAHLFAVHLLAQFREKRAYPAIVRMFGAPGEIPFDLAGDLVTGRLSNILASVYDGNPTPLEGLVENQEANEFVRSAALDAFVILAVTGEMSRDAVVDYFRRLFQGKLERSHTFAWDGLIGAVADLPAPELLAEVRQAYDEGLADSSVADLESIGRGLAAPKPWRRERQYLITDAIAEMEHWSSFHPEEARRGVPSLDDFLLADPMPYATPQPFIRGEKIGRNDPCPCGSGKKYKKCCGNI